MLRSYEIQIVRRGMVLGERAEQAPLEEPYRQVEARRTILPLVIAVWREIEDHRLRRQIAKRDGHGAIDEGFPVPATLVGRSAAITHTGDDKPMVDLVKPAFVA